jgi:hypothetical protein
VPTSAEAEEPLASVAPEENQQAYEAAQEVVANALAAGRWTATDVQTIGPKLSALTQPQFRELVMLLRTAMSQGELVLETAGGLF